MRDTIYGLLFILGLMIFFFFLGWTISTLQYADAYPYSYYQPFDTSLGYWDSGYYERPAYDYFDNFYYYDYDIRPTTYQYYEFTIDWEDPDNWSSSTGLPIIETWSYKVYTEPIAQYNDYWVDTFIYGNYPY